MEYQDYNFNVKLIKHEYITVRARNFEEAIEKADDIAEELCRSKNCESYQVEEDI